MIHNLPVKSLTFKEITIEGYSRAAVQTYWRIPEFKLGFDLGAQPWSFMGTPTWFVSHTHMDHIVALPVYVARRRMMKMEPPTIYLPEHAIEPMQKILQLFQPPGPRPAALHAAADPAGRRDRDVARARGDGFGHGPHGAVVRVRGLGAAAKSSSPSIWTCPARRFAICGSPAWRSPPRCAFRAWPTWATVRPTGLDACPAMFEAEVLIIEMTFVAARHRKDKIHKFGHMHLDDIVERRDKFQNELIIASPLQHALPPQASREHVTQALPDMLDGRLHLWT